MSILYISDKSNSTVKINKLGSNNARNFRILKNRLSPESVELDRVFITQQGVAENAKPDLYIGKQDAQSGEILTLFSKEYPRDDIDVVMLKDDNTAQYDFKYGGHCYNITHRRREDISVGFDFDNVVKDKYQLIIHNADNQQTTVMILVAHPARVTVDSIVYEDMQIKLDVPEGQQVQSNNRMYSIKLVNSTVGSLLDIVEKNVTIVGDYIVMVTSAQKMSNLHIESAGCTIGQSCKYINIGVNCASVYIGDSCSNITIDEKCSNVNIANNCQNIYLHDNVTNFTVGKNSGIDGLVYIGQDSHNINIAEESAKHGQILIGSHCGLNDGQLSLTNQCGSSAIFKIGNSCFCGGHIKFFGESMEGEDTVIEDNVSSGNFEKSA